MVWFDESTHALLFFRYAFPRFWVFLLHTGHRGRGDDEVFDPPRLRYTNTLRALDGETCLTAENARSTRGRRLGSHEGAEWSRSFFLFLFLVHLLFSQMVVRFFLH